MTVFNIDKSLRLLLALSFFLSSLIINAQEIEIDTDGVKFLLEYTMNKKAIVIKPKVRNCTSKSVLIRPFVKVGTIADFIASEGDLLNDINLVKVSINDTYVYDSIVIERADIIENEGVLVDFRFMFLEKDKKDLAKTYYVKRKKFNKKSLGFRISKTF